MFSHDPRERPVFAAKNLDSPLLLRQNPPQSSDKRQSVKALKILLLYPEVPQTFWNLTHALKFFGKLAWSPPLGLLTVAAMLPKEFNLRLRDLNVKPLDEDDL